MGDYLIQYNNLCENNIRINHYKKKINKKKKKYKACNYNWKEFYSDDEDNSYYNYNLNNNYINQTKLKKSRTLSQNSYLTNKDMDKEKDKSKNSKKPKRESRYLLENQNYVLLNNKLNKISNKKVRFRKKNFVKYIDVESYKKYNILNTSTDSSVNSYNDTNEGNNKADVKCTCLIY